jgi:3-oxoacyl-(acyl-carrier-protein) synthase
MSLLAKLLAADPVVITGLGTISCAGESAEALWNAAQSGSVAARWKDFSKGTKRFAVCEAPEISVPLPKLVRQSDRCAQLAYAAAHKAWEHAHIPRQIPRHRIGVALGSSRGPIARLGEGFEESFSGKSKPSALAMASFGSISGAVAQSLGAEGPGAVVSATCASAAFAIPWAAEQIVLGKADIMLAGGADAPLTAPILSQLEAAGILGTGDVPTGICRPFGLNRSGIVPGEGAAFLVMESASHAAKRGVTPLAILCGWANGTDAAGRTDMDSHGHGLARVMREAMAMAGDPGIQHINAHGTGTLKNDLAEARAIASVFGSKTASIPCVSTKPVTGHCMGATPAMEAVIAIHSLLHQTLPPAVNADHADPECKIARTSHQAVRADISRVMSNSSGFWGSQASLIFGKLA